MFAKLLYTILLLSITSSAALGLPLDKKPKPKKIFYSLESVKMKVQSIKDDNAFYESLIPNDNPAYLWLRILRQMRNGEIDKTKTVDSVNRFCKTMRAFVKENDIKTYTDYEWVFPVKGYTSGAIGGVNGSGFNPYGFNFYDMNSGGHPAHDIFILDRDQDCIDDATQKPVEILSMSSGIVVESRTGWTPETDTKGGNIVYVYDNFSNGFFYYAHLKDVFVKVGDVVEPGNVLGTMGRTGKNAFPSRSPTHLHIMYVRSNDGDLIPENIYNMLLEAKVIN